MKKPLMPYYYAPQKQAPSLGRRKPIRRARRVPIRLLAVSGAIMVFLGLSVATTAHGKPAISGVATTIMNSVGVKTATVKSTANPLSNLPDKLPTSLAAVMRNHSASADVAVYDDKTGQTVHYTNVAAGTTYSTASIVKLSILEALLLQDQAAGTGITNDQLAEATPMIENSDNDAATDLWDRVGEGPAMQSFFNQVGTNDTTVDPAGHWGLTQTTALDQLKIVNQFAYPTTNTLLNSASVSTIGTLLAGVESDQQWGVSGGVPASANVALKDGWLDDTDGWDVNSIGHVSGNGVNYTIAILSTGSDSESDGISTVDALSAAVYAAVAAD